MTPADLPRRGSVRFNSWAGLTDHPVLVLRETSKRYWIRWEEDPPPFRKRREQFVPKDVVRFPKEAP